MKRISYNRARAEIQDGDIVFFRVDGTFFSKLVGFFTDSNYSHVGIAFIHNFADPEIPSRVLLVESQALYGRRILTLSHYKDRKMDVWTPVLGWDISHKKALLCKQVTHRYSYLDAIYVGLREFIQNHTNWELPKKNFPGEICSEFIAETQELVECVSPQRLSQALKANGSTIRFEVR